MVAVTLVATITIPVPAAADDPETCAGAVITIFGTDGDDVIVGTKANDVIDAGNGDDVVRSRGGSDIVCGGTGDDVLFGAAGDDVLRGGPGRDKLRGGRGSDALFGGAGDDRQAGGPGDDAIRGGGGSDRASGGEGTDLCQSSHRRTTCEIRPTHSAPVPHPLESLYGPRVHPILGDVRIHTGWDFDSPCGFEVRSSADGEVSAVGVAGINGGYGIRVEVDHGARLKTLYAHLSQALVSPGDFVARGDAIGLIGTTGLSTGCHLHFETRAFNWPVDPVEYMCPLLEPNTPPHVQPCP